jgi:outer membrane protein TolC
MGNTKKRQMKHVKILSYLVLAAFHASGQLNQPLSLDTCYALAYRNYPQVKQMALIAQTKSFSLENASKAYLPQLLLAGQATYQSEVTKLPISLPGMTLKELSKDQYKMYAEINQSLTDPLIIKQQKAIITGNSAIEQEKLNIDLYKLKERINQLFFGILVIDEQKHQSELLLKDLETNIKRVEAGVANGVNLKSQADQLYAEHIKIEQRILEQNTARKAYGDMLAVFIKQEVSEGRVLETPVLMPLNEQMNRPELRLFDAQKNMVDVQNRLLGAKYAPKFSVFMQGGYGRPTLNVLNNDFGTYYIGGARFSWNISNYYTFKKEQQIQGITRNQVDIQREVFLFNTNVVLKQQHTELEKLQNLLKSDDALIALREKISRAAAAQLENGTISMNDYLGMINAEDQAKQNKALHKVQFLLATYTIQNTSGN